MPAHRVNRTVWFLVTWSSLCWQSVNILLPTGSEERGVLAVGSIPAAILCSCQDMKTIALSLHKQAYSWVVKLRNPSEAVLKLQYTPWLTYWPIAMNAARGQYNRIGDYYDRYTASSVFLISVQKVPSYYALWVTNGLVNNLFIPRTRNKTDSLQYKILSTNQMSWSWWFVVKGIVPFHCI